MGNKNIKDHSIPFSKTNQPSAASIKKRAETRKRNTLKKRELADLLNLTLKGNINKAINTVLKSEMGVSAKTLEEALHFIQIAKAITQKDTDSYRALMQTAGLNKPVKVESDVTINGFLDFLKETS